MVPYCSAPSHRPLGDSGLWDAEFVAVHSCEGSGGVSPRFPGYLWRTEV